MRAHLVAAPVLDFRYYGPIEGRVAGIDRSARDRMRLTLDALGTTEVTVGVLAPTPALWRVGLAGVRVASDDPWLSVGAARREWAAGNLAVAAAHAVLDALLTEAQSLG